MMTAAQETISVLPLLQHKVRPVLTPIQGNGHISLMRALQERTFLPSISKMILEIQLLSKFESKLKMTDKELLAQLHS